MDNAAQRMYHPFNNTLTVLLTVLIMRVRLTVNVRLNGEDSPSGGDLAGCRGAGTDVVTTVRGLDVGQGQNTVVLRRS